MRYILNHVKRHSHQTEFKVEFRDGIEEETEKRYVRKNLVVEHLYEPTENLRQLVDKAEAGSNDQPASKEIRPALNA
jgi:hypothetical protein